MIQVQTDYKNHRQYWKTKEYLRQLFGNNVNLKSAVVQNLLATIDSIPESPVYTIAAYGSLLNTNDILRTMPSANNFRKGYIYGFTRIFNMGRLGTGCVLNIEPSQEESELICNFIDISYEDLPEYILREGWYYVEVLEEGDYYDTWKDAAKPNQPVLTVIGDQQIINQSIGVEPQLNYLHLCLTGMKQIAGWEGVQQFLEETMCYSHKARAYISVKDWLNTTDLVDYMITNDYSKR